MSSKITTDLAVDSAVAMSARWRLNTAERQYIDDQIRGIQQHLVDALIRGQHATYVMLDSSSASVSEGDVVCLASDTSATVPTVTKALSAALALAKAAYGVVLKAGSPGSWILVAKGGAVPPTITSLASASPGDVRVNTTTGKCEYIGTLGSSDYGIGKVDNAGWLLVIPGMSAAGGGGGGSAPGGTGTELQARGGPSTLSAVPGTSVDLATGAMLCAPLTGNPCYVFGARASATTDGGGFAACSEAVSTGFYAQAAGKQCVANGAGSTCIGEVSTVEATAANGVSAGYGSNVAGVYASALGCYHSATADQSCVRGLSAGSRLTGQDVHSSGFAGMQGGCAIDMYGYGAGASVNLLLVDGSEFKTRVDTCHEIRIRISGVERGGGSHGKSVHEIVATDIGGSITLTLDGSPINRGQFVAAWTVTISTVGNILRIACNPGAANVDFFARVTWSEVAVTGAAFSPSSLPWDGWWRADTTTLEYDGLPWGPTASAGGSGANGNVIALDTAPSVGTAVNGYSPAHTDGVAMDAQTANTANTFVNPGSGIISLLVKTPATAGAPSPGTPYNTKVLFATVGAACGMAWSTSGVTFYFHDGTVYQEITIACSADAWHHLAMKWDGTNFWARVDSGGWDLGTTTPTTPGVSAAQIANPFLVAKNSYATLFAAADYLEIAASKTVLTDTQLDNYKGYLNSRYALAL